MDVSDIVYSSTESENSLDSDDMSLLNTIEFAKEDEAHNFLGKSRADRSYLPLRQE